MEDVAIFYVHLDHFTVFSYILATFCIVRGNLVYFSRFGILYQEKSGNPALHIHFEQGPGSKEKRLGKKIEICSPKRFH
jgi:hypothetical protein